ncbi:MAG: magnesium transporter [Cytophagales bacterium]|nr:MAG: magnesium transporter [Cytophagales bacterium]TAF62568.1 MAG: magnesium transporter [Cytophagales bacterium]
MYASTTLAHHVEPIRDTLLNCDEQALKQNLNQVPDEVFFALPYELGYDELRSLLLHAEPQQADKLLLSMPPDWRRPVLTLLPESQVAAFVLNYLPVGEAVKTLKECPSSLRHKLVKLLESEEKGIEILSDLPYIKESAGGLMSTELVCIQSNWTVGRCIDEIRDQTARVKELYSLFVVDTRGILIGRVPLRRFLAATPQTLVADLVNEQIVSVMAHAEPQEVAETLEKYNFEALPVVSARGKLVGRVRKRDVAQYFVEKKHTEVSEPEPEEDESILGLAKARLPWLLIGMCGGLLGAETMGLFQNELTVLPALAFFVPLVMATGGNVGIQSSTVVIQALADKKKGKESASRRIFKSGTLAVVNGWFISLLVFAANVAIFQNDFDMSMTVSIALFCVVLVASFLGTVLPLVMNRLGVNPALAAGPFITTANDLVGITVYFTVARMMYTF